MKKLIFLFLLFIPFFASGNVFIDAPQVVLIEESFYLYVNIQDVEMFNSADYSIFYNSSIFSIQSVENGNINGTEIPCIYSLKDGVCKIVSNLSLSAVNGSGYLSKIKFKSIANGSSYISIDGNLSDFYGNKINISWYGKEMIATPTSLRVETPDIATGNFYAFVNISDVSFLSAMNFSLIFDRYFIEFAGIENGSIEGNEVFVYHVENENGLKIVALTNASGSGCIAKIKFRTITSGIANINISDVTLSGFYGEIFAYVINKTILISFSPPVANDDYASTSEDEPVLINVTANDYDIDGSIDLSSITITQNPSHGSVTVHSNGTVTYTPQANYYGSDSLKYKVKDNDGAYSNGAFVNITINSINDEPFANNDYYSIDEDFALIVNAAGILGNDSDEDGDILTSILISGPSHGTVLLNPNGSFIYTPSLNYYGNDSFAYKAYDGQAYSNIATVYIMINSINDAPNKPTLVNPENNSINVSINATLIARVIDMDNDIMTVKFYGRKLGAIWQLIGTKTNVENNSDTSITWYNLEYNTTYEWYAVANDSFSENISEIWRFKTVAYIPPPPVNSPPIAYIDSISPSPANYGQAVNFVGHGSDSDGIIVEYSWRSSIDGFLSNQASFSKSNLSVGTHTIYFKVKDNNGTWSNEVSQTLVINPVNHPPNKPALLYPSNGAIGISINPILSWQCSDADGDELSYDVYFGTSPNPPYKATFTTISYNPGTLSYETTYYWKIVAKDGKGGESSSDIWQFTTMAYTPSPPPANQPPTCSLNANVSHGYAPLYVNFIMNASDADGSIVSWELDVNNDGIAEYNGSALPSTKQYVYANPGNFTAKLIVRDDKGADSETTITIRVLQNNKPVVTIVNPSNGTKISENIVIEGFASDEDGNDTIRSVEIKIDSGQWQLAEGKNSWIYLLNISGIGEGEHIIYARSYDGIDYSEEKYIGITVEKIREEKKSVYPYIFILIAIVIVILFIIRKYRKVI